MQKPLPFLPPGLECNIRLRRITLSHTTGWRFRCSIHGDSLTFKKQKLCIKAGHEHLSDPRKHVQSQNKD